MTTRVDHKALRELCHLLVDSLQKSYCVVTQLGLVRSVATAGGQHWNTDPTAVQIMHAVYNTCFEWVTRARSDVELEELRKSICHCEGEVLHPAQESAHELGRQLAVRNTIPVWTLVLKWISLPFDSPDLAPNLEIRGMHMLSRKTGWPRSITSMLPHGPERTMHALLRLFQTVTAAQRRGLYSALERIMTLCHPLVARLLVRSSRFLRCCIECLIDVPIPAPSSNMNFATRNATIVSEIQLFTQMMMRYVFFSLNETERRGFEGEEPETLLRAYIRCLEICESAVKLMELPMHQQSFAGLGLSYQDIEATTSDLFSLSTRLCQDFPSLHGTHAPAHIWDTIIREKASLRQAPPSHMVDMRFKLAMHHLEVRQRCTAPGCTRTRADGRLHRCAQCKRVPYCSRRCQKAAWAQAIAHRDICKSIGVLCDAYKIPERDVYNYNPPDGLGYAAGYEEISLQVLDHFARLTKLNIATPGSTYTSSLNAYHR
jgi:hypothetical protein